MESLNVFTQNFADLCQEVHSVLLENTEKEGKLKVKIRNKLIAVNINAAQLKISHEMLNFSKTTVNLIWDVSSLEWINSKTPIFFSIADLIIPKNDWISTSENNLSCSYCRIDFSDPQLQREHYKLDWHRYNLKQSLLLKQPIREEEFNEKSKNGKWKLPTIVT